MTAETGKMTVGFIGLGIMGQYMAGHILDVGHVLRVFNRSRHKAEALVDRGAVWCDNLGDVAAECDVVISIVGYPADVEEIYLSPGGILDRARDGAILIDMTTSSPDLARRIADRAAAQGLSALDAPVSGGEGGAKAAALAIMVGGDPDAFAAARPLFEILGKTVSHMGPAGSGQHTKMANQIAIASTMVGVCECLAYAKAAGLSQAATLDVVGTGAASSFLLKGLGPKIVAEDFSPGFFIHHFVKDMSIALEEAEAMQLSLPGLALARKLYRQLVEEGFGEEGTQALIRAYAGIVGGNHAA
ncbi:NAD(P)-dependent oxidoreductase [Aliiruegeria lutimaris]|uniref:3-hydroxyisobutyrate dehydrogenase n=1 Tax=Aliiruegeria lutimaris TaxID=571298 RepID=A0A1G8Q1W6_9RHOB|nr:NAD(P)-dependent oxidoreductase [Aliiruegeria lutimaris]SDI98638.1 3-hydroxyisobutyrate dehydrogenase [Aliiruegeria lutimaris]